MICFETNKFYNSSIKGIFVVLKSTYSGFSNYYLYWCLCLSGEIFLMHSEGFIAYESSPLKL